MIKIDRTMKGTLEEEENVLQKKNITRNYQNEAQKSTKSGIVSDF